MEFINNLAKTLGGAIYSETQTYNVKTILTLTNTTMNNNCALADYTDPYTVQFTCTGRYTADHVNNTTGCGAEIDTSDTEHGDTGQLSKTGKIVVCERITFLNTARRRHI